MLKKHFKTSLGVIISLVFLGLVLKDIDYYHLVEVLGQFNWWVLLFGLVVWLVGYLIRAWRWQVLLSPIKKISFKTSLEILVIGFTANNLLPLRAGELVRAYLIGQKEGISKTSAFATVVAERLFDGIIIVSLTILGATVITLPLWVKNTIIFSSVIFLLALCAFIFLLFFNRQTMILVHFFLRLLPSTLKKRVEDLLNVFTAGIEFLRSPKRLFWVATTSLGIWLTEASFYYLAAISFGFDINFLHALFLKGILNLGILLPSAPGYLGTFEFFIVEGLALMGISETPALGYALVSHFVEFVAITVLGIFYWIRYGISLGRVTREAQNDR